jgi:hypothetical protein
VEKRGRIRHVTDDTAGIIGRKCSACIIDKATETLSEYVIIIDFLWLQWVRERVSD